MENIFLIGKKKKNKIIIIFNRDPLVFQCILNFYRLIFKIIVIIINSFFFRTGKLKLFCGITKSVLEDELDYWQIPIDYLQDEEKLGNNILYNIIFFKNILK